MAKNEKGEDWSKFMNEMNELGPTLRENVVKGKAGLYRADGSNLEHINTPKITGPHGEMLISAETQSKQEAENEKAFKRKFNGKKKPKAKIPGFDKDVNGVPLHVLKRIKKMAPRVTHHKQVVINQWFDDELAKLLPRWCIKRISKKGKIPWYLSWVSLQIQHSRIPFPWGTDACAVYVFKKLHVNQNFVWSDES